MTNFVKSLLYISTCITVLVSCKSDPIAVSQEDNVKSYGSWMLSQAVKDGKVTKTLEGAKFSIDSSSMTTNLFGDDQTFGYTRTGNQLKLNGGQDQLFTVDKSTTDTLILGMERRKKQYQLLLVKADSTAVQ